MLCYGTYIYENLLVISIVLLKYVLKMFNHQRPVYAITELLYEPNLQRFMANIHIVWKSL